MGVAWSRPQKRVIRFAGDGRPFLHTDGSTQSGKTFALCHSFVFHVASNVWPTRGFDGFLVGAPRSVQRQALLRGLEEACRSIGYPYKMYANGTADIGRHHINGCVIGRKESRSAFHGGRYGAVLIDEVTLCDSETVKYAEGRTSKPPRGNHVGKVFTGTNPADPQHWWKVERLDEYPQAHVKFTIDDNPSLSQAYKDQLKRLWTGSLLDRMYYGQWVGHSGLVYPLFTEQVVENDYPDTEPLYYDLTVDHATSGTTHANVIAVWPEHRRLVDEWRHDGRTQGALTTLEQCYAMKRKFEPYMPFHRSYCDSAAAHMIVDMERTIGPVSETNKKVLPGIQQVQMYTAEGNMSVDKEKCPWTVKDMTGYAWDNRAADRGYPDVVLKVNDHACDAIRYYIYSEAQYVELRMMRVV